MAISRRQFLIGCAATGMGSPLYLSTDEIDAKTIQRIPPDHNAVFQHGVASGDPLVDRVILWTRISLPRDGTFLVTWDISLDPEMQQIVQSGSTTTGPDRDYTVKVEPTALTPDTRYYYRFQCEGAMSLVAQTRTLPVGHVERVRYAVASCANYASGYFNVYYLIGRREDIDVVVHLGDYLYEYNTGSHGADPLKNREPLPPREVVTLDDYRQRHAQYKADSDLQFAHQKHPFICVWDDHEFANNAWANGAGNHDESEGDWQQRKAAAMKAYFEWMPVREVYANRSGQIYRSFAFGNLADLIMLDTRMAGRDDPNIQDDPRVLLDNNRSLLGRTQESWLFDELHYSKSVSTTWRLIGQQVMVSQLTAFGQHLNVDQWDGYPMARERMLRFIRDNQIDNVVFLTGDVHSSWANELSLDPNDPLEYTAETGKGVIATELITPAVTSEGIKNDIQARLVEELVYSSHSHVKYVDLYHRGYLVVDVTHERMNAEWYYTPTVEYRTDEERFARRLTVQSGSGVIREKQVSELRVAANQ